MKVTINIEPDNPDGAKYISLTPTEKYNYVAMEIDGHWYDVSTVDLHRALMPFMDIRYEEKEREL